jgi:hypothetical protein
MSAIRPRTSASAMSTIRGYRPASSDVRVHRLHVHEGQVHLRQRLNTSLYLVSNGVGLVQLHLSVYINVQVHP